MRPAKHRYTKNLVATRKGKQKPVLVTCRDEDEQVKVVCDQILEHLEQGIKLQHQAVLFRAGHHSDQLEIELSRRNIPFHKYGGLKFLEAAHVKDMLAFLRILENPRDDMSWFRVLEMFEGVGPRTAERFIADFAERSYDLAELPDIPMPVASQEQYLGLAQMLLDLRKQELTVAAQVERLRLFYDPLVLVLYDNPRPRLRDLEQLELVAQRYKSRVNFISDLTIDPPDSTADLAGPPHKDEDWLVLSTMHSAKGCEWKVVFIIHAADGMIPSDMATEDEESIEEERRLFYVAVTRAKDWLYVVFPLRYYYKRYPLGDGHVYAQLTRFASSEVRSLLDKRGGDSLEVEDGPPTDEQIRAKIARYWERRF
jgi:DNA helicase-2/ATP-dependent DNA helicase PcrA